MTNENRDELTQFLERVHSNQKAHIAKFPDAYRLIKRVNDCLSVAGKNLINPNPVMTGSLLLRSQYAYKAAAGMALSGQVVEAFAMMRLCLEYAGYALAIFNEPTLQDVFMGRHVSADGMKAMKGRFKIGEIRTVIAGFDTKLAEIFDDLYQRAIDFGGHPNPHAAMSATQLGQEGNHITLTTLALTTDPKVLMHTMKSVTQVGLAALFVFQHIFKAKFELLGIRTEMDALRMENL